MKGWLATQISLKSLALPVLVALLAGCQAGAPLQPTVTMDIPPASPACRTSGQAAYSGPLTPTLEEDAGSPAGTPIPTPTLPLALALHPRLGLGISAAAAPEQWAGLLGASWYLDWATHLGPDSSVPEHWQMVRLTAAADGSICFYPSLAALAWQAERYPGQHWIIGNEPDVIWQDNLTPQQFAGSYRLAYQALRQADSTAQIGPGGIAQATPLRLEYLDQVLEAYRQAAGEPLPADFWTVHGFILREEAGSWGVEIPPGMAGATQGELYEVEDHDRMDLFTRQLLAFRAWMAANGYRDRPLVLTEFGLLMPEDYGFDPQRTAAFLIASFDWLDSAADAETGYARDGYRLVQRWAWFSLADALYPASDLADLNLGKLTSLGTAYRGWRESRPD